MIVYVEVNQYEWWSAVRMYMRCFCWIEESHRERSDLSYVQLNMTCRCWIQAFNFVWRVDVESNRSKSHRTTDGRPITILTQLLVSPVWCEFDYYSTQVKDYSLHRLDASLILLFNAIEWLLILQFRCEFDYNFQRNWRTTCITVSIWVWLPS